jgi:hypothetical protein
MSIQKQVLEPHGHPIPNEPFIFLEVIYFSFLILILAVGISE